MKPQVYYYLWQNPGWQMWRMQFAEQMMALEESGLAEKADVHLYVNGSDSDRRELAQKSVLGLYPWVATVHERDINEENLHEGWPLSELWDFSKVLDPDTPVLYMHGKGALTMNKCVYHWYKLMEYYCVDEWQTALPAISGGPRIYDATGCLWWPEPYPHFSGNFWWASALYLASLPDPFTPGGKNPDGSLIPGAYYCDDTRIKFEMWIGANHPCVLNLHATGLNHYISEYPPSRYRSQ